MLHDGDTVALGGVTLTAHLTAGHTRGCTTWTFRAHLAGEPAGRYRNAVIVGGWRPLSQYRLDDKPAEPASYAGIRADFSRTFSTLRSWLVDIYLGAHGIYFDLLPKLQRKHSEGEAVFIDPRGYLQEVNEAQAEFERLAAGQPREP